MIRLASKDLPPASAQVLSQLQQQVDAEPTFEAKAEMAQSLWKSKGGAAGKAAFEVVKEELVKLCVFVGICNYCEQNEASDIEHIFPKSFFPSHAFVWENYLLACKNCNSTFKLDKVHVLDANDEPVLVPRKQAPISNRIAFLNPRKEDPSAFMFLNTQTWRLETVDGLSASEKVKAEKTLEILELNDRDPLLKARKSAAIHYHEQMDNMAKIWTAPDIATLADHLNPYEDKFDLSLPLDVLKADILARRQTYISRYQHPTVWHTIKQLQDQSPKWKRIFEILPMALDW